MLKPAQILDSLHETAGINYMNNKDNIYSPRTAIETAEGYIAEYQSAIARDVNAMDPDDLDELIIKLKQMSDSYFYVLRVMGHYVEEAERQLEIEIDERLRGGHEEYIIPETEDSRSNVFDSLFPPHPMVGSD